ncbi:M23 family metallopeptidase [Saccharicrinis sp. FJH2]|uniref:M23 family metallopeptidase n=1 Tax=Saccharicrinis sp. FJH65 TaxID=3344659 RepID=UPI0035F38A81
MKQYILILFTFFLLFSCKNTNKQAESSDVVPEDTIPVVINREYGLPVDSFIVTHDRVKRNQFLSNILSGYGVSYQTIDKLARSYRDVFDVRKIKVGNKYTVFQTLDSVPQIAYFVYEKTESDYVVYDFRDGVQIYTGQKPIITERKIATGVVNTSLWNTMVDNGYNPMLAVELSDIYAWTIDFFGIEKGDRFRVIYDEDYVDSTSLGISKIIAAEFVNRGDHFLAIPFEQDSTVSFYDEDGNSLRKAFLKAPLKYFSRISSGYSLRRWHPVLKYYRAHQGIDYAAPTGTPVLSIGDGTITKRGYQKNGGGNYLYVKHNSVYTTVYMHLKKFANGMYVGTRVKQGQVIGYVGMTGLASGPHLDFRVIKNGKLMNPLKVKAPPVKPILEANRDSFNVVKKNTIDMLKAIDWNKPEKEE